MSEIKDTPSFVARSSLTFRAPNQRDGVAVWRAVQQAGTLEPNTAYFYLIFCSDFRETCLIAEDDKAIAGVLIGYHPPNDPETAFCWQIGVLPAWRGQGLGKRMLCAWLNLPANREVNWVTATVADDNAASDQLFRSFARSLSATCSVEPHFTADHFPAGHRPEPIYRIGPIPKAARKRV
ncbi:diaminobutyrate acetyltransferase [Orrella daihaiensis]|uniref:L-2,4-diaminobutyric acid acetyltransferase n=1 Tax=Orrella daihaiensis TaxID=2782176 RepID=A0ABY4AMF7_9BURK|nr:diaminobutyrate acetyltransferase [Orrella daihaiensis]UOD49219.1 diaminobutyrate acetyltransferase [Orrella daihaiensis]